MARPTFSVTCAFLALALAAGACSSDKQVNKGGPADGGGGSGGGNDGGSSCAGPAGACPATTRPVNDAYCHGDATGTCTIDANCTAKGSRPVDACCVLVAQPGQGSVPTLKRTTDTNKYADPSGGAPDLSCFDPAHYPPKSTDTTPVTMKGRVVAFASGCDLVGVKIEVFKVKRTGDPATEGDLGDLVGTPVITTSTDPVELETVSKCSDPRKDRDYTYPGVPMNTELVVKTSAATATDGWSALYTYNVYITDSDPDYSNGVYTRELEALANDDFGTIPSVAIGRTISAGNGAIGGEVHDCQNYRLQNAMVDISTSRAGLVYFNESEDDPLPDVNRAQLGTGRTGLFSALDVKPGLVRVSAAGLVPDGNGCNQLVSLGYYDVRVFADGVTSVSFRGLRPFQEP